MGNLIVVLAAGVLLAGNVPIEVQAPIVSDAPTKPAIQEQKEVRTGVEYYKELLREIAEAKGLPENKIIQIEKVIGGQKGTACPNGESTWKAYAVGDVGTSYGLVQIHLPAHRDITKEQALDPEFALNYIVDQFLAGRQGQWTCWRVIYGK